MRTPSSAIHLKTGDVYVIKGTAIDATNGSEEGRLMVIYERNDKTYVRDIREFILKFEIKE
jgi:hypothetical protein